MSQLQSLKERRAAVQSTQKITKAMKMIAVSRLRGAQQSHTAAQPYILELNDIMRTLELQFPQEFAAYTQSVDHAPDLYVLVSANRGLCGSYNQNLFRLMESIIEGELAEDNDIKVITVGKKASEFVARFDDVEHVGHYTLGDTPSFSQADYIANEVLKQMRETQYRYVSCLGTFYKSALVQEPEVTRIFPLEATHEQADQYRNLSVEPKLSECVSHLWEMYVRMKLYQCLVESITSEHASRMRAMDNASRNAESMIEELTLRYNRQRQAAITSELIEIIAGSESMKGDR